MEGFCQGILILEKFCGQFLRKIGGFSGFETSKWLRLAVEQGDHVTQEDFSEMFASGLAIPENHAEVEKWANIESDVSGCEHHFFQ